MYLCTIQCINNIMAKCIPL